MNNVNYAKSPSMTLNGVSTDHTHVVNGINEEISEGGRFDRGGADRKWFLTDGDSVLLSEECEKKVSGRGAFTRSRYKVNGGTYLITGRDWNREDCRFASPEVVEVFVTPEANLEFVEELVRAVGANRVHELPKAIKAVEVKYGLRCPVCEREGCGLTFHKAEEEEKKNKEALARAQAKVLKDGRKKYRLLAVEGPGRRWSYGVKAVERMSDDKAFLFSSGTFSPIDESHEGLAVCDEKTRVEWEVFDGRWRMMRHIYPSIR